MSRANAQSDAANAAGSARRIGRIGQRAKVPTPAAKDVMSTAVITADENVPLSRLAATLEKHRIKRVPILREGRLVGIVSRANLLHGLAALPDTPMETAARGPAPTHERPLRDDASIRASILNALNNEVAPSGVVNVVVADGVVDLWGGVESEDERQAVLAVATSSPGVAEVKDRLTDLSAAFRELFDPHIWA